MATASTAPASPRAPRWRSPGRGRLARAASGARVSSDSTAGGRRWRAWSRPGQSTGRLFGGLQDDDRNLARGLLAVLLKVRVDARVLLVEALVFVAVWHLGMDLELLAKDLDRHVRVRDHVVVPRRVSRGAALGRDDHIVVAVTRVHQWILTNLAGLGTLGGEDQNVAAREWTGCGLATMFAKVLDQRSVEVLHR